MCILQFNIHLIEPAVRKIFGDDLDEKGGKSTYFEDGEDGEADGTEQDRGGFGGTDDVDDLGPCL